ncbi:MAG: HlyC/CorC family transporter [Pseudomonadaceae bacterium]|nr:HlyC/CorC family transporter [Pseudomonadaceae bacterium]
MIDVVTRPFSKLWQRWNRARAMESLTDDLHGAWQEREARPLTKTERELLQNALTFSTATADELCVPRADIVAIPITATYTEVMKAFAESHFSRLPVYGKSLDDIAGVITLKDMVEVVGKERGFKLADCLRPAIFVPETMPATRVLQTMKKHRVGILLVTDEYGGTGGLLTLKDLLGELVGDIEDEHTSDTDEEIAKLASGAYHVPATMPLEDLELELGISLPPPPASDIETLGGLVMHEARRVPAVGEMVALPGYITAKVVKGDARRIQLLELRLPDRLGADKSKKAA